MAAFFSQSASEFLFSPPCPQALKDWIEQDLGWKAQDLREIVVKFQDLESRYAKYGVLAEAFVTREYQGVCEEKSHQFLQLPSGKWQKFKGWMESNNIVFPVTDWEIAYHVDVPSNAKVKLSTYDASCAPSFKTVVEKKELNDSDVFDLMDSIRDELWSNS